MKNYLFILAFVFSINSAEQKEQKEQKAEFELDVVKVKEGFQVTPLPKELIILTMGFLPKQFNLKIPPSNRPNKDKNITNYSVEGCLNVGGMQTGPLADYYLEDEEQNYNNGFAVANHLIEIFNSVDLNNNQLDLLYEKLRDYKAIVTRIILGYILYHEIEDTNSCFSCLKKWKSKNKYGLIITPHENSFYLQSLIKVKDFLMSRGSLDIYLNNLRYKGKNWNFPDDF